MNVDDGKQSLTGLKVLFSPDIHSAIETFLKAILKPLPLLSMIRIPGS
jgi:hypothetical protein